MVREQTTTVVPTTKRKKRERLALPEAATLHVNRAVRAIKNVGNISNYGAVPTDKITDIVDVLQRAINKMSGVLSRPAADPSETFKY